MGVKNCQDIVDAKLGETASPYADIMRTWGGGRVTPDLVLKWGSKVRYVDEVLEM